MDTEAINETVDVLPDLPAENDEWGIFSIWYIVALCFITIVVLILYVVFEKEAEECTSQPPVWKLAIKLGVHFLKHRKQGELLVPASVHYVAGSGSEAYSLVISPRNHSITLNGLRINRENLKAYKELCGYQVHGDGVPICYGEALLYRLIVALVASPKFCLCPIGLIHIEQTMVQHEPLQDHLGAALTAVASVKQYRKCERGVEVDIELRLMRQKRCIWEGVVTLLSRDSTAKKRPRDAQHAEDEDIYEYEEEVNVSGNCGLTYARVTGDYNPHHLYPWSARLLGFKRPIAHGMWTLSRALVEFQKHGNATSRGTKLEVRCRFKRPLLMPGVVIVKHNEISYVETESGCRILVEDAASKDPHLVANVKTTPKETVRTFRRPYKS